MSEYDNIVEAIAELENLEKLRIMIEAVEQKIKDGEINESCISED